MVIGNDFLLLFCKCLNTFDQCEVCIRKLHLPNPSRIGGSIVVGGHFLDCLTRLKQTANCHFHHVGCIKTVSS